VALANANDRVMCGYANVAVGEVRGGGFARDAGGVSRPASETELAITFSAFSVVDTTTVRMPRYGASVGGDTYMGGTRRASAASGAPVTVSPPILAGGPVYTRLTLGGIISWIKSA